MNHTVLDAMSFWCTEDMCEAIRWLSIWSKRLKVHCLLEYLSVFLCLSVFSRGVLLQHLSTAPMNASVEIDSLDAF